MRFRLRTLMFTVAVAALVLGWVVHARGLVAQEEDFAFAVLAMEGVAVTEILAVVASIRFVIRMARKDRAYARWRQRNGGALPSCREDGDA